MGATDQSPDQSTAAKILLLGIVLLTAFRPSDAPWVNDEPIMMEMALRYNRTPSSIYGIPLPFTPCPFGLVGTHGLRYGPAPIWLDQIFLAFTHDVVTMVALRALLFSALTAFSLYLLAKTLGFSPWFAVVTMLSPWLWVFSRSLWDSTWCIPCSAILFSTYARFLKHRKPIDAAIALASGTILLSVHLMSLALVIPLLIHALIFHRRDLWKFKWRLAILLAIAIYLFWPYLYYLTTHFTPENQTNVPSSRGWIYAIFGGHFLTLGLAGTSPGDGWQTQASTTVRTIIDICRDIALLAIPAVWLGIALAIPRGWRAAVRRSPDITDHLCLLSLAIWICQSLLDISTRLYYAPHYYSATWIAYVFLAWLAVRWIAAQIHQPAAAILISLYAASLLIGTTLIAILIAQNGGTRNTNYGLSLSNQLAAVAQLRQYSDDSTMRIDVPQWKTYPRAWQVLLELNPPPASPRPRADLLVRFRNPDSADAHIAVEMIP